MPRGAAARGLKDVRYGTAEVLLQSVLALAKRRDIVWVRGGVQPDADGNLLRDLGCDLGHGYFISRPMDYRAVLAWVRQRILAQRRHT